MIESVKVFVKKVFTSKSFGFLALIFVAATVLLILGKMAAEQWLDLVKWIGGGAVARSAVGDIVPTIQQKKEEIAKTIVDDSDAELASSIVARTDG